MGGSTASRSARVRAAATRVCVVGPDTRFLSGITYYTFGLVAALAREQRVSAVLLRRLLPARLYPGRARVGVQLSELRLPPSVTAVSRLDWYWGTGIWRAAQLLRRQRTEVLILQWWTSAALHSYLALAVVAKWLGASVVVEFHEVLDSGEERLGWVRHYVRAVAPWLFRLSAAFVVHTEHDRELLVNHYGINALRTVLIPHAGYDQYRHDRVPSATGRCRLLFFGVVRPFKGVEDLVAAFNLLALDSPTFELTIIGETWENWTLPDRMIAQSPARDRITRLDRYVTDSEAAAAFAAADVVVLPYLRCSSSGPLHIAMALGLPVVTTSVGGLPEATAGYPGAVTAEPGDPQSLARAILQASTLAGQHFSGAPSWTETASAYAGLLAEVTARRPQPRGGRAGAPAR